MENHSTVILLGNGYDIAYGLNTKYSDFYKSDLFKELCKTPNDLAHFINKANEGKGKELWSDLEEELYNYSITLTKVANEGDPSNLKLTNKNDVFKLTDTEKEIISAKNFRNDFIEVQDCLGKFIVQQMKKPDLGNQENHQNLRYLTDDWLSEDESTLVVSFNYTNTLWGTHSKAKVLYVHGTVQELQPSFRGSLELEPTGGYKCQNIVVGIDEAMQVETAHSFLYKSYNETTNIHKLASILTNAQRYIVFGCSIGKTDRWYFEKVFNKEQTGKTYEIYHFEPNGQLNINSRIKEISKASIADFKERNNVLYLDTSNLAVALDKRKNYYLRYPFNP